MRRRSALLLLGLIVAAGAALAATELVLQDGRVIEGVELRRDGDSYVLVLESGDAIVIPTVLVKVVRLAGARGPLTRAEPQELGEAPPAGPSGLVRAEPRTLAGPEVRPPKTSEQLKVFGAPAQFQQDIVDNEWQPSSDWDMDPARQNNFAPSKWAENVIDPHWQPESAFDADKDVLAGSRSTFQKSIIDNSWAPTDGFAR
jgi:hypothetical protein